MTEEKEKESMYYDDYKIFEEDISRLKRRFPLTFESNKILYALIRCENILVGLNNNLATILEELIPKEEEEEE